MKDIVLSENETGKCGEILDYVTEWCSRNQWAVGIGEMAAGAGLIAAGIQIGHIHLGKDLFGTKVGGFNTESLVGTGLGGGAGAVAGAILGSIGVVPFGGIGIPACLMITGGASVFGAAGFTVGDAVHNFLHPPIDLGKFFEGASLLTIGTALLIDGARRLITDTAFKRLVCDFRDGVIRLAQLTAEIIVDSFESLKKMIKSLAAEGVTLAVGPVIESFVPDFRIIAFGPAVALGIATASLWPFIAGGAAALAVGYGAWRASKLFGDSPSASASSGIKR